MVDMNYALMMDEILITILLIIGMFWIFGMALWEAGKSFEHGFITPRYFYEEWELNWFGSYFMFILLSILSPIGTMTKLLYVIWYGVSHGIKWLFTVGR